jgi:hypothetical protein
MSATARTTTVLADDHAGDGSPPSVAAEVVDGRVLVAAEALPTVLGWTLKPEGLCRAEACVPLWDRDTVVTDDGRVDLLGAAGALDRPALFDEESGVLAVGSPRGDRRRALAGRRAPEVELPDLDGNLHTLEQFLDRRVTLVAFASW